MRSVSIRNRANSVTDCSIVCCSKLACFRPWYRGNVRRICASFCPDFCKRALREFSHTKYFFVTLCEARRKLRGVRAMYIPALILSSMDRGMWTINRQVVCHFQTIRTLLSLFFFFFFLKALRITSYDMPRYLRVFMTDKKLLKGE